MEIIKNLEGNRLEVKLKGRLDAATAIDFDREVVKDLNGVTDLVLDLAKLDYIASAGLRVLLKLQKKMNLQGDMKIKNINREVREVLDMTGFSRLLTIEDAAAPKKLSFNF